VLALRDPVVLAKQVATLDVLSAGRIVLGIGSGWLQPEFDLLGVDFDGRGARTDEGIALVRQCWTGTLDRHGAQVFTTPRPAREVPVVIGGISSRALARAGRVGDGWFAVQQASRAEPSEIERGMASIGAARQRRGRSGKSRTIVYVSRSAHDLGSVARLLPMYRDLGVDDMVVDVDWRDKGCPKFAAEILGIGS
jgi:alkanesulfonate monooxygenase SsuD/methylene tetrahydromethanopterin reductase-like flavin-dependent oxidoreductase (luciferase family)